MMVLDTRVASANILLLHLEASEYTKKQSMKVLDTLVTSANILLLNLVTSEHTRK